MSVQKETTQEWVRDLLQRYGRMGMETWIRLAEATGYHDTDMAICHDMLADLSLSDVATSEAIAYQLDGK